MYLQKVTSKLLVENILIFESYFYSWALGFFILKSILICHSSVEKRIKKHLNTTWFKCNDLIC